MEELRSRALKEIRRMDVVARESTSDPKNVAQFTHLGSILTTECDISTDVHHRIKLASAAFSRLSQCVFQP